MVVAKKNVSFISFTEREELMLRVLNVFGYVDKMFIQDLIKEGMTDRTLYFRRMSMKKLKLIEEFMTGFPVGYASKEKETYYCVTLGEKGIGYASNFPEGKQLKRDPNPWEPQLHHDFMLARVVMEICLTLKNSGFEVEKLMNESGEFKKLTNIRPDGTVIFSMNEDPIRFGAIFVEVERHYLDQEAVNRKLLRYSSAINEEKFDQVVGFGLEHVRVIYVSTTKNKFNNTKEKIKAVGDKGFEILCVEYDNLVKNHIETKYTYPFTEQMVTLTEKISIENGLCYE